MVAQYFTLLSAAAAMALLLEMLAVLLADHQ